MKKKSWWKFPVCLLAFAVMGCDDNNDTDGLTETYTIGGAVTGLEGTLVIGVNEATTIEITSDGTYTADVELEPDTEYTVVINDEPTNQNCTIENASGTISDSDVDNVNINCDNKQWFDPPTQADNLSESISYADFSRIAMDDQGNALVVWNEFDGSTNRVYRRDYRNGQWGTVSQVSISGTDAINPSVAMDELGNAIIVWEQSDGITYGGRIYMAEYRNGAWTVPTDLVNDAISPTGAYYDYAYSPRVAAKNGRAVVAWIQIDGDVEEAIFRSYYQNGSWVHPASISSEISPDGSNAGDTEVAIDTDGNAIIVWEQEYDSYYGGENVFISEYRNGSWTDPTDGNDFINDVTFAYGNSAFDPEVAMDDNGNAIVVWEQYDGLSDDRIYKSEYRNGQWTHDTGSPDVISPDDALVGYDADDPQVAMDNDGNIVVVWEGRDGVSDDVIFYAERRNGSWDTPTDLSDNRLSTDIEDADDPFVAMDNNGNTVVVWEQYDGSQNQIQRAEYRSGAWSSPAATEFVNPAGSYGVFARVAMSDNGDAIISWLQESSGSDQVFVSHYR